MKKYIPKLFIFIMMVVVPFVAYLFLKGGINYRIDSLEALKDKQQLSENVQLILRQNNIDVMDHVTMINLSEKEIDVSQVLSQFDKTPFFQLVTKDTVEVNDAIKVISLNDHTKLLNEFTSDKLVLIDDEGLIRKRYEDGYEFKEVIRHIATLLPFVEKKEKRDDK